VWDRCVGQVCVGQVCVGDRCVCGGQEENRVCIDIKT